MVPEGPYQRMEELQGVAGVPQVAVEEEEEAGNRRMTAVEVVEAADSRVKVVEETSVLQEGAVEEGGRTADHQSSVRSAETLAPSSDPGLDAAQKTPSAACPSSYLRSSSCPPSHAS